MSSFPPQRTYKPTSLSRLETQTWLATYLQSAETIALLQPDAQLTASGPVAAQGMSSVTMHNLRRLLDGLNGKYSIHEMGLLETGDKNFKAAVVNVDELPTSADEWQDKSEFEREQSVEVGDIAERDPGHGVTKNVGKAMEPKVGIDKTARKKAKKERKLESRRAQQKAKADE